LVAKLIGRGEVMIFNGLGSAAFRRAGMNRLPSIDVIIANCSSDRFT
jgi:hypothetical protein